MIALARNESRARDAVAAALRNRARVVIPAVVVAETVRGNGARDAGVNRVVASVDEVAVTDEKSARIAGRLLAHAGSTATVDALVVADAVRRGGATVLTGDADDLRRLAGAHPEVVVRASSAA